jgi:hypothetical protein
MSEKIKAKCLEILAIINTDEDMAMWSCHTSGIEELDYDVLKEVENKVEEIIKFTKLLAEADEVMTSYDFVKEQWEWWTEHIKKREASLELGEKENEDKTLKLNIIKDQRLEGNIPKPEEEKIV